MSNFDTISRDIQSLVTESKADQIAEMLIAGTLTKAQIARAVGANYSQVHMKEKELLTKGLLKNRAPLGKKGKTAGAGKVAKAPASKKKVVKPVTRAVARPAGTPVEKKTPIQAKIDEMIIHMTAVIDSPTAVDLITAATDAVPESIKDSMTSADLNELIRSRIKALIRNGDLFQSPNGTFSTNGEEDEIDDSGADSDEDANVLRSKREDDAIFGGDDDDDGWLGSALGQGRRTGGYHL